jgi:hypothetical protein
MGTVGDTFGTGMPGGLDNRFVPGDGIYRASTDARLTPGSPRLDTSAKYLILFQVISSKGLDPRSLLTPVDLEKVEKALKTVFGTEENNKIKFTVGEEKTKLEKQQRKPSTQW